MLLQARAQHCFTDRHLLSVNDQPRGAFRGRWFSEGVDIRLTSHHRLHFEREGFLWTHFILTDGATGKEVGRAERAGWLTSAWTLRLHDGAATMISEGIFKLGYRVDRGPDLLATVERLDMCRRGWRVIRHGGLVFTDLVLIGLVYHTIINRSRVSSGSD